MRGLPSLRSFLLLSSLVILSTLAISILLYLNQEPETVYVEVGQARIQKFEKSKSEVKFNFKAWKDGVVTVLKPEIMKNCSKIIAGDRDEIKRVRLQNYRWTNELSDKKFLAMSNNCSWLKDYFSDNLYITKTEKSFPIAFTLVVHERPQQIMRLFKFLYRSHNFYCIHPDIKSSEINTAILHNTARCLDNVHIVSKRVDVVWGDASILEAQMNCLSDLTERRNKMPERRKWKYVINLCGKELPLATNHEIVSRLINLNGSSSIRAHKIRQGDWQSKYRLQHKKVPFGLTLYKGMTYMGLSYNFTHFLLTNSTAIMVRKFFNDCLSPEEHFFSTMFMIPGVPGGYRPGIEYLPMNLCFWRSIDNDDGEKKCSGQIVHNICIPTIGGLKEIINRSNDGRKALFHNKYFMELDHVIMDCMEERLVARNKIEYHEDCLG